MPKAQSKMMDKYMKYAKLVRQDLDETAKDNEWLREELAQVCLVGLV